MAGFARKIVAENRLDAEAGGPITVLSGRIEDIDSLPVHQVGPGLCSPSLQGILEIPFPYHKGAHWLGSVLRCC